MNLHGFEYTGNLPWLKDSLIFLAKHGSVAYGLNTPTSDLDIKGVCVPTERYFYGMSKFEQTEFKDLSKNVEGVVYEIRKFLSLAAECNPNIVELLWEEDEDYIFTTPECDMLRKNRDLFISKKAKYTYAGYAYNQLKRIKTHHRWLIYGETIEKPSRQSCGLPDKQPEVLSVAQAAIQKQLDTWNLKELSDLEPAHRIAVQESVTDMLTQMNLASDEQKWEAATRAVNVNKDIVKSLLDEKRYQTVSFEWKQYNTWLASRNKARAELERKHGYDTKHAMHLVRLMKTCKEILSTGKLIVKRPDREELLSIRNGAWSYEQLLCWASDCEKEIDVLYESSTIQKSCPRSAIESICIEIVRSKLSTH